MRYVGGFYGIALSEAQRTRPRSRNSGAAQKPRIRAAQPRRQEFEHLDNALMGLIIWRGVAGTMCSDFELLVLNATLQISEAVVLSEEEHTNVLARERPSILSKSSWKQCTICTQMATHFGKAATISKAKEAQRGRPKAELLREDGAEVVVFVRPTANSPTSIMSARIAPDPFRGSRSSKRSEAL